MAAETVAEVLGTDEHKVSAVRQARADAIRLLRPHYVFSWQGRWAYSAGPHRSLHDADLGYVICHPTGVVTEVFPL